MIALSTSKSYSIHASLLYRIAVISLLSIHAGLLAHLATWNSPTDLEPAFLASGISHWKFFRFELYRVNPPLPRMVSALPLLLTGCKTDWKNYEVRPGTRAEYAVGKDFVTANRPYSQLLFVYARLACIPFSLAGGYFAYRWSREMYGDGAGILTLFLWAFEPNLLAHASLATPDCACWSAGLVASYVYWRWLRRPTWSQAALAGLMLGLALLTKFSWIILYIVWPALFAVWPHPEMPRRLIALPVGLIRIRDTRLRAVQLVLIAALSLYVVNLGYMFDGSGTRLGSFTFVSSAFKGHEQPGANGNRFSNTWLAELPCPFPAQFMLGIDTQKRDCEFFHTPSYLDGTFSHDGWWYYYLYGLSLKIPLGCVAIALATIAMRLLSKHPLFNKDDLVPGVTSLFLLVVLSWQTALNHHLRYCFPVIALLLVWLGQCPSLWSQISVERKWSWTVRAAGYALTGVCLLSFAIVSLRSHPRQLSFFNLIAGGERAGWLRLLGSSFDWGQDAHFRSLSTSQHLRDRQIIPVVGYHHHETEPWNDTFQAMAISDALTTVRRDLSRPQTLVVSIDWVLQQHRTVDAFIHFLQCDYPQNADSLPKIEVHQLYLIVTFPSQPIRR